MKNCYFFVTSSGQNEGGRADCSTLQSAFRVEFLFCSWPVAGNFLDCPRDFQARIRNVPRPFYPKYRFQEPSCPGDRGWQRNRSRHRGDVSSLSCERSAPQRYEVGLEDPEGRNGL